MSLSLVTNRTAGATYSLADDCNRVGNAVATLQTALSAAGCNLTLTVKTDWAITDNPTQSDMERYRSNVSAVRAALTALSSTPAVPSSMRFLTYHGANNIEQILLDVEDAINRLSQSLWYAGEIGCGEV